MMRAGRCAFLACALLAPAPGVLAQALAEDVREAHQQRQFGASGTRRVDNLRQRHRRAFGANGTDHQV
ncbi:MAG: hypothetical protein RSF79_30675, partial [Janthinobacterium sp.]